MKKLLIGLTVLTSIASFGASIENDCPEIYSAIMAYRIEIRDSYVAEEIEKEDVRTLGLATEGLFSTVEWDGDEDIQQVCQNVKKALGFIKKTASKL